MRITVTERVVALNPGFTANWHPHGVGTGEVHHQSAP